MFLVLLLLVSVLEFLILPADIVSDLSLLSNVIRTEAPRGQGTMHSACYTLRVVAALHWVFPDGF